MGGIKQFVFHLCQLRVLAVYRESENIIKLLNCLQRESKKIIEGRKLYLIELFHAECYKLNIDLVFKKTFNKTICLLKANNRYRIFVSDALVN